MPRTARSRCPGIPLHIVQRGVDRSAVFFTVENRRVYLTYLEEFAATFDCEVHAFVLMTNHVHLLATPHRPECMSLIMKGLNQCYVQYVNRSRRRTGGLWEGRYHASFVASDEYFLACHRYIELNPVRAGMVRHPGAYRWSSYRVNAEGMESTLIRPHALYVTLGADERARRAAYRRLFDLQLEDWRIDEFRKRTNAGHAIGTEAFVAALEHQTGRRLSPGPRGRPRSVPI